jgi:DNA-binding NarL/FixJ family response regulator
MATPSRRGAILIVDDDEDLRASICSVIESAGYSTLQAASGEEALKLTARKAPELVLLDVCLPGFSGYQVCHELRQRFGDGLPIVFISAARTQSYDRVAGLLIGGDEYLSKPIAPDELLIRIERLVLRAVPVAPAVSAKLTSREREVLRLLADGIGATEIGARLFIAPKTVSTHIDHILSKLGVHSRAQAVALAYRRDLIDASA